MATIPASPAYLNGRFAPLDTLQVSVMDRGFLFGDGAYEVIPVYDRKPFRLDEHLARLEHSLAALQLDNPYSLSKWQRLVQELIVRQVFVDQSIYVEVTRGVAWPRSHAFPIQPSPTVFVYSEPLVPPAQALVAKGLQAVTVEDVRWQRCNIKAISLVANVLLRQAAVAAEADEAILIRDGCLVEGSASNIFVVKQGELLVPPPSGHMLTGITYDVVLELARENHWPLVLRPIRAAELEQADELWLTSSSKEILAIVSLDGRPVGNGLPGPMYHSMFALYQDFKTRVMRHSSP